MKNLIRKILNEQLTDEERDEKYYNYFVSYLSKKFPTLLEKLKRSGGGFSHHKRVGIYDVPVFKPKEYIDSDSNVWVLIDMDNDNTCTYGLNSDLLDTTYDMFNDDWLWERFFNEYHKLPFKGDNWCFN